MIRLPQNTFYANAAIVSFKKKTLKFKEINQILIHMFKFYISGEIGTPWNDRNVLFKWGK